MSQTKVLRVRFIYRHYTRVLTWLMKKSTADITLEAHLAVLEIVGLAALALHVVACGFYLLSRQTGHAGCACEHVFALFALQVTSLH